MDIWFVRISPCHLGRLILKLGIIMIKTSNNQSKVESSPHKEFNHSTAQHYELSSNNQWSDLNFEKVYSLVDTPEKATAHQLKMDNEFFTTEDFTKSVVEHREGKICLEIGPGPSGGWVSHAKNAGQRILIEPLGLAYRNYQIRKFGKTLIGDDVQILITPAEDLIKDYVGAIDGAIMCRNALDHCSDPLKILENIGLYAAPGCFLFLWTDLWHHHDVDDGHCNITQDVEAFKESIQKMDFEIIHEFSDRNRETLNIGLNAIKH